MEADRLEIRVVSARGLREVQGGDLCENQLLQREERAAKLVDSDSNFYSYRR